MAPRYAVGDRVRVTAAWTECLGQLGTIAEPDEAIRGIRPDWHGHVRLDSDNAVSYWVEMDVPESVSSFVDAAEFPEDALEPADPDSWRDA
jgi:hypothetical protein